MARVLYKSAYYQVRVYTPAGLRKLCKVMAEAYFCILSQNNTRETNEAKIAKRADLFMDSKLGAINFKDTHITLELRKAGWFTYRIYLTHMKPNELAAIDVIIREYGFKPKVKEYGIVEV